MRAVVSFLYRTGLIRLIDYLDTRLLMPPLRHLPIGLAERIANWRGRYRYILDMDWRSIALGQPRVRAETEKALEVLCGPGTDIRSRVRSRFLHQSREEMEATFFAGRKDWPRKVVYENLESFRAVQEEGRGLVLLSAHFDSCVAGITFLGSEGFRVNIYYDDIVYDSRVPRHIQDFFRYKYGGMESRANGGTMVAKSALKDVYARLLKGELFVMVSDVLNRPEGVPVTFLNRPCAAPLGTLRIAQKTDSSLGAFVTRWEGKGVYRTICATPPRLSPATEPEAVLAKYYAFLSEQILASPERWWASDKMLEFPEPAGAGRA
jgi:lauroyl/myristoyl acyltransferase